MPQTLGHALPDVYIYPEKRRKEFDMATMNKVKVDKNGMVGEGVEFERIRRITGYLVGTLDRFNNAKRAEVLDRVPHAARGR